MHCDKINVPIICHLILSNMTSFLLHGCCSCNNRKIATLIFRKLASMCIGTVSFEYNLVADPTARLWHKQDFL